MVGKAGKPTKEAICMAERTEQHQLVKLSDTDFRLEEPDQDVRGLDVYDRDGNQIGSVEDLYATRPSARCASWTWALGASSG